MRIRTFDFSLVHDAKKNKKLKAPLEIDDITRESNISAFFFRSIQLSHFSASFNSQVRS